MMLRQEDIFSITEVEYAILEPNGKLSVMKKIEKQEITKEDMKIVKPPLHYLPSEIIVDGKVIKHNLEEFQLDQNWLMKQLRQQKISSVKSVFYAEIQENGALFIEKY